MRVSGNRERPGLGTKPGNQATPEAGNPESGYPETAFGVIRGEADCNAFSDPPYPCGPETGKSCFPEIKASESLSRSQPRPSDAPLERCNSEGETITTRHGKTGNR